MKNVANAYRLAVVGPESSGKTTAVEQIAADLRSQGFSVGVAAEAGRIYAQDLAVDHEWTMADELAVGRLHLELMRQAMKDSNVVVSDGAVITPRVWSLRAFGEELAELAEIDDTGRYDLVALAVPDLPWRDDPLRTNPTNRAIEFDLYQRLLAETDVQVVTMSGEGLSRLEPLREALLESLAT